MFDPLKLDAHVDEIVAAAKQQVAGGQPLRDRIQSRARALAAEVPANMDFVREMAGSSATRHAEHEARAVNVGR